MASRVPENETKEDKTLRLAQARTISALDDIRLIGNLTGPSYSMMTAEHVAQMESVLNGAVKAAMNRLRNVETASSVFSFETPASETPAVPETPAASGETVTGEAASETPAVPETGDASPPATDAVVIGDAEVAARRANHRRAG